MKKKLFVVIAILLCVSALFAACTKPEDTRENGWAGKFDMSLPDPDEIFTEQADIPEGQDGWFYTINDEFDKYDSVAKLLYDPVTNPKSIWAASPHAIRWENTEKPENSNWWCPDMLEVKDGCVIVKSEQRDNHVCSSGICPAAGRFTSGIETRVVEALDGLDSTKGTSDKILFGQAFGYFEVSVKFPDTDGMWSAFWLQSSNQRKVGNAGEDGTEIDVYESAFRLANNDAGSKMGHALLWDGYGRSSKVEGPQFRLDGVNLYDGNFHTFALKWTPTHYVFYIDGKPTWASDAGGVSKVREFLRFTCEIDTGDGIGPHGMNIGAFAPAEHGDSNFYIDSVKVLQYTGFLGDIKDDGYFDGRLDGAN